MRVKKLKKFLKLFKCNVVYINFNDGKFVNDVMKHERVKRMTIWHDVPNDTLVVCLDRPVYLTHEVISNEPMDTQYPIGTKVYIQYCSYDNTAVITDGKFFGKESDTWKCTSQCKLEQLKELNEKERIK